MPPLLLTCTLRTEPTRSLPDVVALWADLRAGGTVAYIELGPLDNAETIELANALVDKPMRAKDIESLTAEASGNPLYLVEAVRSGLASADLELLPSSVAEVIDIRFGRLGPSARELVFLMAVVGRPVTVPLLAQAGACPEEGVMRDLVELSLARVIQRTEEGYEFRSEESGWSGKTSTSAVARSASNNRRAECTVNKEYVCFR